jgi:hypothetical protein
VWLQPPFERVQEEIRQKRDKELADKAALWWDPLRVMEDERKRAMLDHDAIEAAKAPAAVPKGS